MGTEMGTGTLTETGTETATVKATAKGDGKHGQRALRPEIILRCKTAALSLEITCDCRENKYYKVSYKCSTEPEAVARLG